MFNNAVIDKSNSSGFKFHKSLSLFFIIILIIPTIFISCSEPSGPGLIPAPYISLSIGDERQVISLSDSSTMLWIIADTLRRADGKLVYQSNWYYGMDTIPSVHYHLIDDGYFIGTELDTLRDTTFYVIGSVFAEQKLAKTYPYDGEYWHNIFCSWGDTSVSTFTAHHIEYESTIAGIFTDCFRFDTDFGASIYYGRGIGYLGISFNDSTKYSVAYLKVNGQELGSKLPAKDPTGLGRNSTIKRPDYILGCFNWMSRHS